MISHDCARKVNRRLAALYGQRWNVHIGITLFEEFEHILTDERYIEAIRRHYTHPEHGMYPPVPGDINRQLTEINLELAIKRRQKQQRKRLENMKSTATILDRSGWRQKIKQASAHRGAIAKILHQTFGLDFSQPEDRAVLEKIIRQQIQQERPMLLEEAIAIGQRQLDQRRPYHPKKARSSESMARHEATSLAVEEYTASSARAPHSATGATSTQEG